MKYSPFPHRVTLSVSMCPCERVFFEWRCFCSRTFSLSLMPITVYKVHGTLEMGKGSARAGYFFFVPRTYIRQHFPFIIQYGFVC